MLNSLQVHYRRIKIIYTYICISTYMSECSSNLLFSYEETRNTSAITSGHDTVETNKANVSMCDSTLSSCLKVASANISEF